MKKKIIGFLLIILIICFSNCGNYSATRKNQSTSDTLIDSNLKAFVNRSTYKTLTKEILDTIPNNKLNQTVFDNIVLKMNKDLSNDYEVIMKLSKGRQAIYSIWVIDEEVNNGGFNQLYFNGYEKLAKLAETGFLIIGAKKFADLTKKANQLFQRIKPDLDKYKDGTLESFSESYKNNPLDKYDDEYYKLNESDSLNYMIVKYIRNNPIEFIDK